MASISPYVSILQEVMSGDNLDLMYMSQSMCAISASPFLRDTAFSGSIVGFDLLPSNTHFRGTM